MRLRIKEERLKKEISQKELAEKSGYSVAYISEIESGKKIPTLNSLYDIAIALNVCPKELMRFECYDKGFEGCIVTTKYIKE